MAEERVAKKRRRNIDDVELGVIDADLLRHEIEGDLGASTRSCADLLGLADVLIRLYGTVGIDHQALGGGIIGFPEQKLERNVLAERERQREPAVTTSRLSLLRPASGGAPD